MVTTHYLKTTVPAEVKERVHQSAQQELITESVWLRRVVTAALGNARAEERADSHAQLQPSFRRTDVLADAAKPLPGRVSIRLRREDRLLLRERSAARGLASTTYVSVLVRSHLRQLAPLPKEELKALKRSVAELSAIGRNLNQIARAVNQGQHVAVRSEDLRSMLKVCEAMRRHVAGLIEVNVESWEVGHARVQD